MKLPWASEALPSALIALLCLLLGAWAIRSAAPGLWRVSGWVLLAAGILALAMTAVFFRDPERRIAPAPGEVLAPADGRVMRVERIFEDRHFHAHAWRIAIFMHVGNVHVQRVPADGRLLWTQHFPGRFRPAFLEQAASQNEQQWYGFACGPHKLALVQISGLLARRIRCWVRPGEDLPAGRRLGMIMLGSEVDLYLPEEAVIRVKPGDKTTAGRTVVAAW